MSKKAKKLTSAKKIVLTGPESSGKTTLCKDLARYFSTNWVAEYARTYVANLGRAYTQADIVQIAQKQHTQEQQAAQQNDIFFCDTSMLVLKVWSDYKYGYCDPWIVAQFHKNSVDLYVLCCPDIPWEADPLREHPQEREQLYAIYKKELQQANKAFVEVHGTAEERQRKVLNRLVK